MRKSFQTLSITFEIAGVGDDNGVLLELVQCAHLRANTKCFFTNTSQEHVGELADMRFLWVFVNIIDGGCQSPVCSNAVGPNGVLPALKSRGGKAGLQ